MSKRTEGMSVPVPQASAARLAVEVWRTARVVEALPESESRQRLTRGIARLQRLLEELGLRVWDPSGSPLSVGLAVNVVDRITVPSLNTPRVHETLRPVVFFADRVILWGEVVGSLPPEDSDPAQAECA